jgi:translation initiation factor IF-1
MKAGPKLPAKVIEMRPNAIVRVRLEDGREVDCHLSGNERINVVRLIPGDAVTVEISPFDTRRGRIVTEGKRS